MGSCRRKALARVVMAGLCLVLASCTASYIPETELETVEKEDLDTAYWWRVKFRIHWPKDQEQDFSLHPLIADQVIAPVLLSRGESMELWRFHRRAARDAAGHQFSFIYFTSRDTANEVNQAIRDNPVTQDLLAAGMLDRVIYDSGKSNQQTAVEATSDPNWPDEIQKSWPSYIMGVSATWLDLIQQFKADSPPPQDANIHEMKRYYTTLNARVTDQWGRYGRHAYLHHLNAVFGYEPLFIKQTGTWEKF